MQRVLNGASEIIARLLCVRTMMRGRDAIFHTDLGEVVTNSFLLRPDIFTRVLQIGARLAKAHIYSQNWLSVLP